MRCVNLTITSLTYCSTLKGRTNKKSVYWVGLDHWMAEVINALWVWKLLLRESLCCAAHTCSLWGHASVTYGPTQWSVTHRHWSNLVEQTHLPLPLTHCISILLHPAHPRHCRSQSAVLNRLACVINRTEPEHSQLVSAVRYNFPRGPSPKPQYHRLQRRLAAVADPATYTFTTDQILMTPVCVSVFISFYFRQLGP